MEIVLPCKRTILLDDVDSDLICRYKWHITDSGYAARNTSRMEFGVKVNKRIWLHKVVFSRVEPNYAGLVDHKNRNKLDCRRENLRASDRSGNSQNSSKRYNKQCQYKGVMKTSYGFIAQIKIDARKVHLGTFQSEVEAAIAYNKAAKKYHGEFASLNIVGQEKDPIDVREKRRDEKDRFFGVYPSGKKFRARVTVQGEKISLGSYETAIEAANAYDNYLKENGLKGGHYRLNLP